MQPQNGNPPAERDPREREAEQRALGILEHTLHVQHDQPQLRVLHEDVGRNALTEWRPLVEAAEKTHAAEAGSRRRRSREHSSKRRLMLLWAIPLILVWAAAAYAVIFMLNNGEL